jgi:hypothetical protein
LKLVKAILSNDELRRNDSRFPIAPGRFLTVSPAGFMGHFIDTEGNCMAFHSMK